MCSQQISWVNISRQRREHSSKPCYSFIHASVFNLLIMLMCRHRMWATPVSNFGCWAPRGCVNRDLGCHRVSRGRGKTAIWWYLWSQWWQYMPRDGFKLCAAQQSALLGNNENWFLLGEHWQHGRYGSPLFWQETKQDAAWVVAVGPQSLTLSAWPGAMSSRLFVQTSALITQSVSISSPSLSISFAHTLTFGLFQPIRRHFLPAN